MSKRKSTFNFFGIKSGGVVKAVNLNTNYDAAATAAAHNHGGSGDRVTNITLMETAKGTDIVNINSDLTGKGIGFKYEESQSSRGPSTNSVPSAPQTTEKAGVYNSLKRPGQVLIINNRFNTLGRKINPSVNRERYKGLIRLRAENDVLTANTLFTETLGLGDENVVVEENVNAEGLLKILSDHKNECIDKESGFSAVVIMSHGGSKPDSILMEDLVEIDLFKDILVHFNHTNFCEFVGKPKLFFVQAFETLDYNFEDFMDMEMDAGGYYTSGSGHTSDTPEGEGAPNALPSSSSEPKAKRPRHDLTVGKLEDTFVSRPSLPFRAALNYSNEDSAYILFLSEIFGDIGTKADLKEVHELLRQNIVEPVIAQKDQDKYGRFRDIKFYDDYKFSKLFLF